MKVERLVVVTKAFSAKVRVQNGRVVFAAKPIAWAARMRLSALEDWLMEHHPQAWIVSDGDGGIPSWSEVDRVYRHHTRQCVTV